MEKTVTISLYEYDELRAIKMACEGRIVKVHWDGGFTFSSENEVIDKIMNLLEASEKRYMQTYLELEATKCKLEKKETRWRI